MFRPLAGRKAKPVNFIVPRWLPLGRVVLMAGDGGTGKSSIFRHVAAKLSAGKPALGGDYAPPPPCKIVMMAAEDDYEEVVIPSLIAEGADLSNFEEVDYVKTTKDGKEARVPFGLEHLDLLKKKLTDNPDVKCVVIDPIASFIGRAGIKSKDGEELRLVLDPLSEMARELGILILVLVHVNKDKAMRAVYRIAGSAQMVNAVRLAYMVGVDPDDPNRRLMMAVKKNLAEIPGDALAWRADRPSPAELATHRKRPELADLSDADFAKVSKQMVRLEFDAPVQADPDRMMGAGQKGGERDPNKVEKCTEWMAEFLKDFAYPSDEIVTAAARVKPSGFTPDNVFKAKAILKDRIGLRNKLYGFGKGSAWWSGIGDPATWTQRPDPHTTTHESPNSHESHESHESHDSEKTPGNAQSHETHQTHETWETQETHETGELFPGTDLDPLHR